MLRCRFSQAMKMIICKLWDTHIYFLNTLYDCFVSPLPSNVTWTNAVSKVWHSNWESSLKFSHLGLHYNWVDQHGAKSSFFSSSFVNKAGVGHYINPWAKRDLKPKLRNRHICTCGSPVCKSKIVPLFISNAPPCLICSVAEFLLPVGLTCTS